MHKDFNKDLPLGKKAEREAAKKLEARGFTNIEIIEGNFTPYDIKANFQNKLYTFEVKHDIMAPKTGNAAIEYVSRGKMSGIRATKADYWIHKIGSNFYIIKTSMLRQKMLVEKSFDRDTVGGDKGSGTKMYLVSTKTFISWCKRL